MTPPKFLRVIDSHTAGEPTRVVVEGGPDLGGDPAAVRERLQNEHDWLRRSVILEPRGSDVMVGALLLPPTSSDAVAGVIFFNNVGYLNMCGHGTLGVVATLRYLGKIEPGVCLLETPVGNVAAELHVDGRASLQNVPSFRYRKQVSVEVEGFGTIHGDVAWGGNWFFLVSDHGQELKPIRTRELTEFCMRIDAALTNAGIRGKDGGKIDHIELFAEPDDPSACDSKNFVLCPGMAYDRSPCGTGTSAKLACLAGDGKLKEGEVWRQASIIGSVFEGTYRRDGDQIIPTITGRAFVNADTKVLFDPNDPFACGIETIG